MPESSRCIEVKLEGGRVPPRPPTGVLRAWLAFSTSHVVPRRQTMNVTWIRSPVPLHDPWPDTPPQDTYPYAVGARPRPSGEKHIPVCTINPALTKGFT